MKLWPPGDYKKKAKERGRDPEIIDAALAQAERVQRADYPPILTLGHLAWHTDTEYQFLRSIVSRHFDPYRYFWMRKRRGGKRLICVPTDEIHRVQRWICQHVLAKAKPHPCSFAYSPGSTPLSAASVHLGARWLIKLDVQRFFESISEIDVYRVFQSMGYCNLVSFELARLVTRQPRTTRGPLSARWLSRIWPPMSIRRYTVARMGSLPQGASTSPMLSNLAVRQFDSEMDAMCKQRGLTMSRYSDDIAFSTADAGFSRADAESVVAAAYSIMRAHGLSPKSSKTTIVSPGARKVVLGVLVDGDRPRLTKVFRDRLEIHLHFVEKLGPAIHATRRSFNSVSGLRRHLAGLISYARQIDPSFGDRLMQRFAKIAWESPSEDE